MQFSVGDKVVHPQYGPGQIARVEHWDPMDKEKCYYVLEIPGQGLTVYVPVCRIDELGMRLAVPQSRLPQVLHILRSSPCLLPEDHQERQEQISAKLKTGRVVQLARVVRDLTWHRRRARLTKKDSDYLKQGQALLAAEMALVSGNDMSNTSKLIEATITAAMAGVLS